SCADVASYPDGAVSTLPRTRNMSPCRSERVTSDGIVAFSAAAVNPAATTVLADDLVSNFVVMTGAGNSAPTFVRAAGTSRGMAPNASATFAFGVAMPGREIVI